MPINEMGTRETVGFVVTVATTALAWRRTNGGAAQWRSMKRLAAGRIHLTADQSLASRRSLKLQLRS